MFQESFEGVCNVSRLFQGRLNGILRQFSRGSAGYLKKGKKVCQETFHVVPRKFKCFNGISIKLQGCFKRILIGFQGYFKDIQREFQERFKGVTRVFQGSFKGVSRKI